MAIQSSIYPILRNEPINNNPPSSSSSPSQITTHKASTLPPHIFIGRHGGIAKYGHLRIQDKVRNVSASSAIIA